MAPLAHRPLVIGQDYTWIWDSPGGVQPGSTPVLTIHWPTGARAYALNALREDVAVVSVGSDRASLTLAEDITAEARGLVGDVGGQCWLSLGAGGEIPIKLTSIVGTTARMAERLHRGNVGGGTLRWGRWTASIPAVDAGAQPMPRVLWSLSWTEQPGGDAPVVPRHLQGHLRVVRWILDTGLTHDQLLVWVPDLGGLVPGRQDSWAPQVEAARGSLGRKLQATMRKQGIKAWQDQVDPTAFIEAHALMAAYKILAAQTAAGRNLAEARDHFRGAAYEALGIAMEAVLVDLDNDGQLDAGEEDVDIQAPPNFVGGASDGALADYDYARIDDER